MNSELKADKQNELREGVFALTSSGDSPRPLRGRAYHRALKRGDKWAIMENNDREQLNLLYQTITESILKRPFFEITPETYLPIKIGECGWAK